MHYFNLRFCIVLVMMIYSFLIFFSMSSKVVFPMQGDEIMQNKVYEIEIEESGLYRILVWGIIPKNEDGQFLEYDVVINDETDEVKLYPFEDGWHYMPIKNSEGNVFLQKGLNRISISSNTCLNPEFEKLVVYDSDELVHKSVYDIEGKRAFEVVSDKRSSTNTVNYEYAYQKGMESGYSFYTTLTLSKGNVLNIDVKGDGKDYIVQIFDFVSPDNFTDSSFVGSNPGLSVVIPYNGIYGIRVRPAELDTEGKCNLSIFKRDSAASLFGRTFLYDGIEVCSKGLSWNVDCKGNYNCFTAQSSGDPILWLETVDYESSDMMMKKKHKVVGFNDNYGKTEDFDWGKESRIKKEYIGESLAFLTSSSSSDNYVKSDIYMGCQSNLDFENGMESSSQNVFISGKRDGLYNCAAWAGGISNDWIWPPQNPLYNLLLNKDNNLSWLDKSLIAFDNYFGSERYPGCALFTREGVTSENEVIVLWYANPDKDSPITAYGHVSVKNGADLNEHGYSWESKLGSGYRVMHPRETMSWRFPGIGESYRVLRPAVNSCIEEAVENKDVVIEYIQFSGDDKKIINQKIKELDSKEIDKFEYLYSNWKTYANYNYVNDPIIIKQSTEYQDLYRYLLLHRQFIYLMINKLMEEDYESSVFIESILTEVGIPVFEMGMLREEVKRYGMPVYRPYLSAVTLQCKKYINEARSVNRRKPESLSNVNDIQYSNTSSYGFRISDGDIMVDRFDTSVGSVNVIIRNTDGRIICSKYMDHKESDELRIQIGSGIYLVCIYIDGVLNTKKVSL